MPPALPTGWRRLFIVEVLLCLATCVQWLLDPDSYVKAIFGLAPSLATRLLVWQGGSVVFTVFVYFYARQLFSRAFNLALFRHFQEAMAIGDVIMLALSAASIRTATSGVLLAAQAGMAALWLTLRIVFLWRVRSPAV